MSSLSSQRMHQPLRKGFAIASLVLGILSIPTLGLLGVGCIVGLVLGIVALNRAIKKPAVYGGKGLAVAGIVTNSLAIVLAPIIGIIAAIAIPSLLRARVSANEAQAIGDTRSIISAEMTYASANAGFYDTLDCLATPASCIPNYPSDAPSFIGPELTPSVKGGYTRTFHPGPPADVEPSQRSRLSPSSVNSFAYVAVPIGQGTTGVRAFCGDSTGRICYTSDGSAPEVTGGKCAETCIDF